jgi:hypothetical protein
MRFSDIISASVHSRMRMATMQWALSGKKSRTNFRQSGDPIHLPHSYTERDPRTGFDRLPSRFDTHGLSMKSQHPIVRLNTTDGKIVLILALPIFAAAMWYGISHQFEDIGLYTVAMMLASWGVAGRGVFVVRKWQEWRAQSGRGPNA